MKAFVLSTLLLQAVVVHAQQETESPADATGQIVNANVDNGSTLPAGAPFSNLGAVTPTAPTDALPTSAADAILPGSNDIVLPSANIDGLATAVLSVISSVLDATRFGPSVEPVSRPLSASATGRRLPGQPAPIIAPAPLKAPAPVPSPTGKARTGGFAGLSVDEGDPQGPVEEVGSEPVDGQSVDTPEGVPVEETPVEETPVEETPVDETPVEETPAEEQPTEPTDQPTDDQPLDEQPVDDQPVDDQPVDDQPTDDQPTDDQPVDDQPTDDQPTDDQPTDDQPTDDQPTDDQPTDDQPTDDQPTDDQPTDDQPTGDQPTDDQPTDDQPSDDEPSNEDPTYDDPSNPGDGGDPYPGTPTNDQPGSDEPWTGGNPSTGGGRPPAPLPVGPSGWENQDNGFYDGEDYGHGPTTGKAKGQGKSPSGTQGNGYPDSGYGIGEECPAWCLEDDSYPVFETSSAAPVEATYTGYKMKHKRKKITTKPHRIAVSVDDNVIYDSNYAREVAVTPPSGGFDAFNWPTKHIDSGSVPTTLPSGSNSNGPPAYGLPYPYEETTDHPYDSEFDQNTDYDDHDDDKLPQWLVDLHNGKTTKGKKGKKKAKGKCPKSCIRTATLSTLTSSPTDFSSASEDISTTTDEPIISVPTTFITLTTDDSPLIPSTNSNPSSPTSTGKPGLPAGYVSSGDTWTGTTLAGLCPKTCNPFNPRENFCGTTTGCTTTGGSNYYCACRAGYKVGKAADKDFSQQFKVPGQPYVYTWPGAVCDELCGDSLCNEVMERAKCV